MTNQRCVRVRLDRFDHPAAHRQRLRESIYPAIEEASALGMVDRFYFFLTTDRLDLCFRLCRGARGAGLQRILQRHGISEPVTPYRAPSDGELVSLTAVTCLTRLLHEAGDPVQAYEVTVRQMGNQLGLRDAIGGRRQVVRRAPRWQRGSTAPS